jgi:hypothetical protein
MKSGDLLDLDRGYIVHKLGTDPEPHPSACI